VRVHYCEGEWREDCGDNLAFLKQYWPLFLVLLFGFIFVGITIYWRKRQRIIASTFKEGAKPSQKAFKFVNLEDFDVAAIEQAVEDEELELSTQQHEDSEDELEGGEKKKNSQSKNRFGS